MGNTPPTTPVFSFSTNVTVRLEKPESDLVPGDVVSGTLDLRCEMVDGSSGSSKGGRFNSSNNDNDNGSNSTNDAQEALQLLPLRFHERYGGITVTVTVVEYAVRRPGDVERQELVVADAYRLGRFVEFPDPQQQRQNQQKRQKQQQQGEQDPTVAAPSRTTTARALLSMEYPFEIELPQREASLDRVEMVDGMDDDVLDRRARARAAMHHDGDDDGDGDAPDGVSLDSCCSFGDSSFSMDRDDDDDDDDDSECDDDDSDDRRWEMLLLSSSSEDKRHSLSLSLSEPTTTTTTTVANNNDDDDNNSKKFRRRYAYKVKAVLEPRRRRPQPQQ